MFLTLVGAIPLNIAIVCPSGGESQTDYMCKSNHRLLTAVIFAPTLILVLVSSILCLTQSLDPTVAKLALLLVAHETGIMFRIVLS